MDLLKTFFPEFQGNYKTEYNLIRVNDTQLTLEFNVAGIPESNVDVEVSGNNLVVSVRDVTDDRDYVYRGLSSKSFVRTFALRNDTQVKEATIKNGILVITLETIVPEEKKPKKILITH